MCMPRTPSRLEALLAKRVDGDEGLAECSLTERLVDAFQKRQVGALFLLPLNDAVHDSAAEEDERSDDRVA